MYNCPGFPTGARILVELRDYQQDLLAPGQRPWADTAAGAWTPHSSAPALTNGAVLLMSQTASRRFAVAKAGGDYDYNDSLTQRMGALWRN